MMSTTARTTIYEADTVPSMQTIPTCSVIVGEHQFVAAQSAMGWRLELAGQGTGTAAAAPAVNAAGRRPD